MFHAMSVQAAGRTAIHTRKNLRMLQGMHTKGDGTSEEALSTAPKALDENPWMFRTKSAARRSECKVRHADLLQPIKSELAHLEQHGINASSLDHLHWPSFFKIMRGAINENKGRPFFQIHQGRLYAHRDSFGAVFPFPAVKNSTMHDAEAWGGPVRQICAVLKSVPDLPPMRFMVNDEDDTERFSDLPVFVPWKVKGSIAINIPSDQLDLSAHSLETRDWTGNSRETPGEPTWAEKLPKAFFAGRLSDDSATILTNRGKRKKLQELFDHDPEGRQLLDIHVDDNERIAKHFYSFNEEAKLKYQLVMDGQAARNSFSLFLAMRSVVLKPYSPYYEYFEPALVAYEHFVPINVTDSESSKWDLKAKILWAREHDADAKRIAEKGSRFARDHLWYDGPKCYLLELLHQYHELMHFDDALPVEFASSPDICEQMRVSDEADVRYYTEMRGRRSCWQVGSGDICCSH